MVSDASKKKTAQKKAAAAAKRGAKTAAAAALKKAAAIGGTANGNSSSDSLVNGMGTLTISDRTCTGVLCSHPLSRDIRVRMIIEIESLLFYEF